MLKIEIELTRPNHAYSILFEPGLCTNWRAEVEDRVPASSYLVLMDANLARMRSVPPHGSAEGKWHWLWVEPGEERKSLAQYAELCETALKFGLDRSTVVVALGGGVTGDIAGFVAATLLRGMRLVQIPTTLLAQVDSSVGGKNGVNTDSGKNLVGTFLQPELVLIDPTVLDTLPRREYLAGLAEVVKTAVLDGPVLFDDVQKSVEMLKALNHGYISGLIAKCCRVKTGFVMSDERDKGRRQLLNFGHTFGHVLEALAGYDGSVVHGEAVSVGMVLACNFSVERGIMSAGEAGEVERLLVALGLPTRVAELGGGKLDWRELLLGEAAMSALATDKKAESGKIGLVIPYGIGDCRFEKGFSAKEVLEFMRSHRD